MKRKKHKATPTAANGVLYTLQARAEELAEAQHHTLSHWQPAKRKWGKGSMVAWCTVCADEAIVLPWGGTRHAHTTLQRSLPAIVGEAVFEACWDAGTERKH